MKCSPLEGCYQIYSIGDGSFLRQIFDALAAICGSGDFVSSCAIALLLGVFTTLFRSVLQGALRVDLGSIFTSLLLYMLLFVPKGTVLVEDVYTGSDYVVDQVPLGAAVPGHLISLLGFHVAEILDQGFSDPSSQLGITRRPFLEALTVISRLQDEEHTSAIWDTLQKDSGNIQVKASLENFLKDCIMLRYQYHPESSALTDSRVSAMSLLGSFKSRIYGTAVYDMNGKKELDCAGASELATSWMGQISQDLISRAWSQTPGLSGQTPGAVINGAVNFLSSAAVTGTDYVKAVLLEQLFHNAQEGFYASQRDFLGAVMVSQATSQRNVQWAAEQSMFMTTVRPFVTFFEGFVYAVTPCAAVLMCLGTFGIGVAIRYFQVLIWIELWMPVLSIINLYAVHSARGEIIALAETGASPDSLYAVSSTFRILENYMATAGMLAASTPLIALFLVSGGSFVFTGIASRLGGSDQVDEKLLAPDIARQMPLLTNENQSSVATATGTVLSSRNSQLPVISFDETDTRAIQQAYEKSSGKAMSSSRTVTENWVQGLGRSSSYDRQEAINQAVSSSGSSVLTSLWNQSVQESRKTGTDAGVVFMSAFEKLTGQSGLSRSMTGDRTSLNAGASGDLGETVGKSSRETTGHEVHIPAVSELNMPAMSQPGSAKGKNFRMGGEARAGVDHQVSAGTEKSFTSSQGEDLRTSMSQSRRNTLAQEQGRTLASGYVNTDSQMLKSDLSRGIALSRSQRESRDSRQDSSRGVQQQFMESFTNAQRYQNAAIRSQGENWKQQGDLRSFAYDARRSDPELLDKIRSSVLSSAGSGKITALASDFQGRYGISDPVTARDMAVLSWAHRGTEDERAMTFALWWETTGLAGDNPHSSSGVSNSFSGEKISRGDVKSGNLSGGVDMKGTGTDSSKWTGTFQGEQGNQDLSSAYKSSGIDGLRREFHNASDKFNERLRGSEELFSEAYQKRFSAYSEKIRDLNNQVLQEASLLRKFTVNRKMREDGREHLSLGDSPAVLSSADFAPGTFLGQSARFLNSVLGDDQAVTGLFSGAGNLTKAQGRAVITAALGEDFTGMLLSEAGSDNNGMVSINSEFMRNYADRYGFDINNPEDVKNLHIRAQTFTELRKAYTSGLGINLGSASAVAGRIRELDESRRALINNSSLQDELMLQRERLE
ncbi:MAG: conjugal transfer protein TraG N-terminal domain-containing protein [Succinivibrionaceae bacterium]